MELLGVLVLLAAVPWNLVAVGFGVQGWLSRARRREHGVRVGKMMLVGSHALLILTLGGWAVGRWFLADTAVRIAGSAAFVGSVLMVAYGLIPMVVMVGLLSAGSRSEDCEALSESSRCPVVRSADRF